MIKAIESELYKISKNENLFFVYKKMWRENYVTS